MTLEEAGKKASRQESFLPERSVPNSLFTNNSHLAEALVCRLDSVSERFRKWQHVNVADSLDGFFPFQTMGFAKLVRVQSLRKRLQNLMPRLEMSINPLN